MPWVGTLAERWVKSEKRGGWREDSYSTPARRRNCCGKADLRSKLFGLIGHALALVEFRLDTITAHYRELPSFLRCLFPSSSSFRLCSSFVRWGNQMLVITTQQPQVKPDEPTSASFFRCPYFIFSYNFRFLLLISILFISSSASAGTGTDFPLAFFVFSTSRSKAP